MFNASGCSSACATLEPPPYSSDMEISPAHPATSHEVPWVQFTIPSATCEDRVEEIYEDLCYVKFTSATPEVSTRLEYLKNCSSGNVWYTSMLLLLVC